MAVSKQCSGSHIGFRLSDALAPSLLRFSLKFSKYLICLKNFPGPLSPKTSYAIKNLGPQKEPKSLFKIFKVLLNQLLDVNFVTVQRLHTVGVLLVLAYLYQPSPFVLHLDLLTLVVSYRIDKNQLLLFDVLVYGFRKLTVDDLYVV